MFCTVFGFGLDTTVHDMLYVIRRPGLLARSLIAMFVLMPAVAIGLAKFFDFRRVVEIALVALSILPSRRCCPNEKDKPVDAAPTLLV